MNEIIFSNDNTNKFLFWDDNTIFKLLGSGQLKGHLNLFLNDKINYPSLYSHKYSLAENQILDITTWIKSTLSTNDTLKILIIDSTWSEEPFIYYLERVSLNDFIILEDKDIIYKGYLNYDKSIPTLKNLIGVHTQLNNKYPYIVKNSNQNYYTGTVSATFVEENENMNWGYDFTNAVQYRINFKKWLYNGQPKILTFINGNKYIISISGNINDNLEGDFDNIITTFNWYEIAEYNQTNLYEYGFTGNISDWYNLEPMTDDSLSKIQLEKLIKYVPKNESDVINFNDNQIDILRDYAFANSPIIVTVEMTALESIGNYAFRGCNMLQEAIFSKVTVINENAFNGCSNLYNLVIKTDSVCSLGTNALSNTPISNTSVTNAYLYVPNNLKNSYATSWGIDIAKIRSIEGSEYDE